MVLRHVCTLLVLTGVLLSTGCCCWHRRCCGPSMSCCQPACQSCCKPGFADATAFYPPGDVRIAPIPAPPMK